MCFIPIPMGFPVPLGIPFPCTSLLYSRPVEAQSIEVVTNQWFIYTPSGVNPGGVSTHTHRGAILYGSGNDAHCRLSIQCSVKEITIFLYRKHSLVVKYTKMCLRPGLRHVPRCGSSRWSQDLLVGWRGETHSPHDPPPHPHRHLRLVDHHHHHHHRDICNAPITVKKRKRALHMLR